MLIDDVKKIEKYKQKMENNPKYKQKIEKIEKKYFFKHDIREGVRSIYIDKHNNKVVVLENGDILQIEGPRVSPHFTGFLIAYCVLLFAGLPLMLIGVIKPEFKSIADAINILIIAAAIILNIFTIVFNRNIMLKHKWLFLFIIMTLLFNIYNLIS